MVPLDLEVDPFVLVVPFDPDVVPLLDYEFASFVAEWPGKTELYRMFPIFFNLNP